jgi:hypothetical protein
MIGYSQSLGQHQLNCPAYPHVVWIDDLFTSTQIMLRQIGEHGPTYRD